MAYSKIIIEFNTVPIPNEVLNFTETNLGLVLNETFKASRLSSGQVTLPVFVEGHEEIPPPHEGHPGWPATEDHYNGYTSLNYKTAFNLDYNSSGLFTVVSNNGAVDEGLGTVTITANYPGAVFILNSSNSDAVITIVNESAIPEINITDVNYSTATSNQCQNVKVNVETNLLATKIISPISVNSNTNNPFSFDWVRGQTFNVVVEDSNGKQATQSVTTPSALNASNFTIQITNSPSGATVVIIGVNNNGLVLQYSLDNSTWQTSNTFSGLDAGDFTLYVKDQFGCSFSKPFTIEDFETDPNPSIGSKIPYFYISKSNSLRFALRQIWNDITVFKNDENTLSCESDVVLPYQEIQDFKTEDVITTQFKSNYAINAVKTIDSNENEVNVPIIKKSNNIGIKDKRQAIKYNLGSGQTGIYFTAGNTYDFDTNVVNGTYVLNGGLPEWGRIGNYFQINSSWFQIEQIIFDESKMADVLVTSNVYTGVDASIIVGSIYNRENYEIYEFVINMIDFEDNLFRVQINAENDLFPDVEYLSEEINVSDIVSELLEIRYRNTTNTDINYSTGIEHLIRVPFNKLNGRYDEESETYKTDTTSKLLSADLYEVDEVVFEPNTKEIWRKVNIALTHEIVSINGVGYVKNAGFNTDGPLGETNLYVLTAAMIKTSNVYNSVSNAPFEYTEEPIDMPSLIETDSGYLEY